MSLKYLLLDSEKLDTTSVKSVILDFAPDSIVYTATTLQEAQRVLSVLFIDVLFVNIRRGELTEEGVLAAFSSRTFEIVFIDVYNPQTVRTYKDDTVHHLFKPIKKTEFKSMLQRLNDYVNARINHKEQQAEAGNEYILSKKLSVSHREGIYFLPLKNIVYFEADNTYSTITMADKQKILTTKPLGKLEETLPKEWFFRIHKTYIINLFHFRNYLSKDGYFAVMNSGDRLSISRYRLAKFLSTMRSLQ